MKIGAWVFANKKGFIKFIVNEKVRQVNTIIGWEYLSTSVTMSEVKKIVFECSEENNHEVKTISLPTGKEITLVIFNSTESDGHAEIAPILMSYVEGDKYDTK